GQPSAMIADNARPLRTRHILWMIEHQPEHFALHDANGTISASGSALADPDGFREAGRLWSAHFVNDATPQPAIFVNALAFYRTANPEFAHRLAERGRTAHPGSAPLAEAQGALFAFTILGVQSLDTYNRPIAFSETPEESALALADRNELESSKDPAQLGG